MNPKISIPDMDKFVSKYEIKADNVNKVAVKAIDATTKWMLKNMQEKVEEHKKTGKALEALKREPAEERANFISGQVGALYISKGRKDFDGFHLIYHEHVFAPWYEPTMKKKAKMRKIQEQIFKSEGYIN